MLKHFGILALVHSSTVACAKGLLTAPIKKNAEKSPLKVCSAHAGPDILAPVHISLDMCQAKLSRRFNAQQSAWLGCT